MTTVSLRDLADQRTVESLERAQRHSQSILDECKQCIQAFLEHKGLDSESLCFVAVGSVGRLEALQASDLDLIPVATNQKTLRDYKGLDQELRKTITEQLDGIHVSSGQDLTKPTCKPDLTRSASIGGTADNDSNLTKRILILTESQQSGGQYEIKKVQESILLAYAKPDRTRGRHVLSLCNDIARYYRTLCIQYKAKVDNEDKDWCTRNLKLRHSRKFWYFSCMVSIAATAHKAPTDQDNYVDLLLEAFSQAPQDRLISAVGQYSRIATSELLERYAFFLEFMAEQDHRKALADIMHAKRYDVSLNNPFPTLKLNSDLLHNAMISIVQEMPPDIRNKIYDWFLL